MRNEREKVRVTFFFRKNRPALQSWDFLAIPYFQTLNTFDPWHVFGEKTAISYPQPHNQQIALLAINLWMITARTKSSGNARKKKEENKQCKRNDGGTLGVHHHPYSRVCTQCIPNEGMYFLYSVLFARYVVFHFMAPKRNIISLLLLKTILCFGVPMNSSARQTWTGGRGGGVWRVVVPGTTSAIHGL